MLLPSWGVTEKGSPDFMSECSCLTQKDSVPFSRNLALCPRAEVSPKGQKQPLAPVSGGTLLGVQGRWPLRKERCVCLVTQAVHPFPFSGSGLGPAGQGGAEMRSHLPPG